MATGEKAEGHEMKPLPHWAWGLVKGGTPEFPNGVRFFHSTLDNEKNPHGVNNYSRRYYIGAMKGEILSAKPIIFGSEDDDLTSTERAGCRHFKSNVVFVSGGILNPDGSLVLSVGVNDSSCLLVRVRPDQLNL
jgi:hypothetical protein